MVSFRISAAVLLAMLAVPALAAAPEPAVQAPATVPAAIAAALADPARPHDQVARDRERHAAELLRFAGIKPGDRVADFMSGGAYFTRLFSRIVGEGGHVYAFLPEEQLRNCAPVETQGTRSLAGESHYANLTILSAPVARFRAPEPLDLVWTSLNFHDLYDSFMGPADVPQVVAALFASLKPGGVLVVVDHVAQPGSKVRDTETLHRIEPAVILEVVQAAGFRLEAQSDLLHNGADTHELRVFDPAIRGHTDQVVLRFRKPRGSPAISPTSAGGDAR